MKHRFFAAVLALFVATAALFGAKNTSQVKGRIIEAASGEPLSFATISIHTEGDKVVTGATADIEGRFIIANLPYGEYMLKVSFMGYKTVEQQIKVADALLELEDILIEEDAEQLASAVISEKIPLIEQKLDKLVMNVSERVSTQGSNAIDILRKAPGVSIDMDGNILLNGKGVAVWIDGRPSHLSGSSLEILLKGTDGTTIDKIEIIANPSAKYDAEGSGGIINIKTKKNFLKGFNGSISATYGGMMFDDLYRDQADGSINLNYRSEKTNNFFTYSPVYYNSGAELKTVLDYGKEGMVKQESDSFLDFFALTHSFRVGSDFFASKKNIFGYIVSGMIGDGSQKSTKGKDNYTDLFSDVIQLQRTLTDIDTKNDENSVSANINHTHIFSEEKGAEITSNIDYNYFDLRSRTLQTNQTLLTNGDLAANLINTLYHTENKDNSSSQILNIISAKTDFQMAFWGTGQLQAGAKWAMTITDNDMSNNNWLTPDYGYGKKTVNSNFEYTEHIGAAYVSMSKMFSPKFTASAGLRAEYTHSFGDWISSGTTSKKSYLDFFPTVFVNYSPSQKHRFSLHYSRRIYRPRFGQLNPFEDYADANTLIVGNPELMPQYSQGVSLSYGYSQYINIIADYSHAKNVIMQTPSFDHATGIKRLGWDNSGSQSVFSAGISLTEVPIIKEYLFLTLSGYYLNVYNSIGSNLPQDEGFEISKITESRSNTFQTSGTLTAILPANYKLELSGWYMSSVASGYFVASPQYMMDFGVKKSLLDNKMTISLTVNDLLRSLGSNVVMKDIVDGQEKVVYTLQQPYQGQRVKLSLSYSFGQSKATRRRNVGTSDETSRVGSSK